LNGSINDSLSAYLAQYYVDNLNKPKKCYVNLSTNELKQLSNFLGIQFFNPKSNKFKTILKNAAANANAYFNANYLVYQKKQQQTIEAYDSLKRIIGIDNLSIINVFDMSNLFGNDRVGAMIALENGSFNKNLYRKFIIKDLQSNSDYEYMYEVIKRNFSNQLQNQQSLANLIIVDGGTIQINAAKKALNELKLDKVIPVIGLSKDHMHKTDAIVFDDKQKIKLDRKSGLYFYLLNIQEEVHRYAINFFRYRSNNSAFHSYLNEIPGLGKKSIDKLLEHYENVGNIKNASVEELSQFVSKKIAKLIKSKIQ